MAEGCHAAPALSSPGLGPRFRRMKGARGFGTIMLLLVLAVVLYLVARNWEAFGPAAVQVKKHKDGPILDAHGEEEAAKEVRSGKIPDIEEMDRNVDQHASETFGAMEALKDN